MWMILKELVNYSKGEMKGILVFSFLWFVLTATQPLTGQVKPCSIFEHFSPGDRLTYDHYDAKNKLQKRTVQIVASNKIEAGYHTVRLDQTTQNAKGIVLKQEEIITHCKDQVLYFNPIHHIPEEAFNGIENLDYEADYKLIALPVGDTESDSLPNFSLSMSLGQQGTGAIVDLQFNMTHRHIGKADSVTLNERLFWAKPFSYQTTTRTKILLARKTLEFTHIDLYDVQLGLLVRSEVRNKNGKSLRYSVLSEYKKN